MGYSLEFRGKGVKIGSLYWRKPIFIGVRCRVYGVEAKVSALPIFLPITHNL